MLKRSKKVKCLVFIYSFGIVLTTGVNQREQLVVLSAELKELKETVASIKQGTVLSQSSKRIPPSLSVNACVYVAAIPLHDLCRLLLKRCMIKLLKRCSLMAQSSELNTVISVCSLNVQVFL